MAALAGIGDMPDTIEDRAVIMSGQPPVEYATASRHGEAARSLAAAWGITEERAAACLGDPVEYRAEHRRHMTPGQAMREMERRYRAPHG